MEKVIELNDFPLPNRVTQKRILKFIALKYQPPCCLISMILWILLLNESLYNLTLILPPKRKKQTKFLRKKQKMILLKK